MQYLLKKNYIWILLVIFSTPLFFLNIHTAFSWGGDDFAQYIKEAQNIAGGKPYYHSSYIFNPYNICFAPPQYPPGFPLIMAPVVKIWGIGMKPLCYLNSFLAACLLFALFAYFRKHTGILSALCIALIITYSQAIIDMKQGILSDLPCTLFTTLYLVFRNHPTFNWKRIVLLCIIACMVALIRSQGIILILAEVLFGIITIAKEYFTNKKLSIKVILANASVQIFGGSILLTLLVTKLIFYAPATASGYYAGIFKDAFSKDFLSIIRDNMNPFVQSVSSFFYFDTNAGLRTTMVSYMVAFGLSFSAIGFIISISKRLSFDNVFFVLMCLMMLFYPIHDLRFFLPVVAILYYYCFLAIKRIAPIVTKAGPHKVALGVVLLYFITGFRYYKTVFNLKDEQTQQAQNDRVVSYISQHVSDTDVVISVRPRILALYTNKKSIIHAWQQPMEFNKKVFDSLNAKYLLVCKGIADDYFSTYLSKVQQPRDSMTIADGFVLYTMR